MGEGWSTCLHRAVEMGVDEQAQDGREEAPDRYECLDGHFVGGDGKHERDHAEGIDASVTGE